VKQDIFLKYIVETVTSSSEPMNFKEIALKCNLKHKTNIKSNDIVQLFEKIIPKKELEDLGLIFENVFKENNIRYYFKETDISKINKLINEDINLQKISVNDLKIVKRLNFRVFKNHIQPKLVCLNSVSINTKDVKKELKNKDKKIIINEDIKLPKKTSTKDNVNEGSEENDIDELKEKVELFLSKIKDNNTNHYFENELIIRRLKEEEHSIKLKMIILINNLPKFLKNVIALYIESNNDSEKTNHLFHFWEGIFAFCSDLSHGDYNKKEGEKEDNFELYSKEFISFGSWRLSSDLNILDYFILKYNNEFNKNFNISDFFIKGRQERNEIKGHDSIRNKEEVYISLKLMELEICKAIPFLVYFFDNINIFKIEYIIANNDFFYIKKIKNNYCEYDLLPINEFNMHLSGGDFYISNKKNTHFQSFAKYNIIKENEDSYYIHSGLKSYDSEKNNKFIFEDLLCFKNYTNAHRNDEIHLPISYFKGAEELKIKAKSRKKTNIKNKIIDILKNNNVSNNPLKCKKDIFFYEEVVEVKDFKKQINKIFKNIVINFDLEYYDNLLFVKRMTKEKSPKSYFHYIEEDGNQKDYDLYELILGYYNDRLGCRMERGLLSNIDGIEAEKAEKRTSFTNIKKVVEDIFCGSEDKKIYFEIDKFELRQSDIADNDALYFKINFKLDLFVKNNIEDICKMKKKEILKTSLIYI
jgi:hypothetical protein